MTRYSALMACYRSGQMSEADMQAAMRADPRFAAYVKRQDEIRFNQGKRG